jgi:uncharacterized protein YggE
MTRINAKQEFAERFFKIPKVFFTNEKYRKLSSDSKLAYGILRDRFNLSVKNGWLDDNGDIYFLFSNEHLAEILDCSSRTVVTIKKALIQAELLEAVKQGQNKADKLYIHMPEVSNDDIYKIQKDETLEAVGKCKNFTSGSAKFASPEVQNLHPNELELKELELKELERNNIIYSILDFYKFSLEDIGNIKGYFKINPLEVKKHLLIKQASKMDTMIKLGKPIYDKPIYFIRGYEALLEADNKSEVERAKRKAKQEAEEQNTSPVPFYNWLES